MRTDALAIIPARGGSRRIPRKNIRPFLGHPIIKYSIDAARASGVFTEVMVSSDDDEILGVARDLGAAVPFKRSEATATDTATTAEVTLEVLEEYARRGRTFESVCVIYSTAPFVSAARLAEAHRVLGGGDVDAVIPVTEFSFPIWRSFKMEGDRLQFNWPENAVRRSQDLPKAFHDCGQFYFLRVAAFRRERRIVMSNTAPVVVPETETQDIDTEADWAIAEMKYALLAARRAAPDLQSRPVNSE